MSPVLRHALLPLDDCVHALQPTIPHLTRSSLHHWPQPPALSRLPEVSGDKPTKKRFQSYPIGYVPIDIAELQTAQVQTAGGKLHVLVAIDRTSTFAFARLVEKAGKMAAAQLPRAICSPPLLIGSTPC